VQEPFLREITPANLLSFGPNPEPIKLNQLNILIGANGSGKSNLIEVIHVLRSTPVDLLPAFRPRFLDWIWQGSIKNRASLTVSLGGYKFQATHTITFGADSKGFLIEEEEISDEYGYIYKIDGNHGLIRSTDGIRETIIDPFGAGYSVLSQFKDSIIYPQLNFISHNYKRFRIYREWQFGRLSTLRQPQPTDLRHEVLEEDFSNLAMHLNYLRSFPLVRRKLVEQLQNVFAGITDFDISVVGGTAQIYLIEGDYRIPATRLSDGTLRYLCLLAILCNPEPQPLICLEEPELGLHPDLLSGLVDLIKECSARTQMIVTTHSEFIVDGFSDDPESVVVVDKEDGITKMKRLSHDSLKAWLEEYSLGQLWNRGQIGGTRW